MAPSSTTAPTGAVVQVLYPSTTTFDMKYYLSTHVPMVKKAWASKGMHTCVVTELDKSTGFAVQCLMLWESKAAADAAFAKDDGEMREMMDDIANFSSEKPTRWFSTVVG